jgi:hypothetical protein
MLSLVALTGCVPLAIKEQERVEAELNNRIVAASDAGLKYLATAYNNGVYADQYLRFVYPEESIPCPLANNCTVTYRLLDAYFDVLFLEEVGADMTNIKAQQADAHAIISALAERWTNERINNVLTSMPGELGIALDTYCIVGFLQRDPDMANKVASYLDDNNNWMSSSHYTEDVWRNIADESWCLRLFIVTDHERQLTETLIATLINDTEKFRIDEHIADQDKLAAVYHTLYVLTDYEQKYNDNRFREEKLQFADFLSYFSFKHIGLNTLMAANLLDVMVYAEYDNKAALSDMAIQVLDQQEAGGFWRMADDAPPDSVQVFTTFRALIGLQRFMNTLT